MKLSDNLKIIRKDNNLSQEQLAEKLGVSRQAVSKWESGQSYPEMDKVLLICKLFNFNIDELMNENVMEVSQNKQSKTNINKYIEDFFGFINKTIDMLSVMRFRDRLKCLLENIIMCAIVVVVFLVLSAIGGHIFANAFGFLSSNIFIIIRNFLESFFTILYLILSATVLLHIFKVRYLDYYEIVKEKNDEEKQNENEIEKEEQEEVYDDKRKVFIEKKKEKIIIRDPNHSQSKFLNGLARICLAFIKFIAICIAICFAITFVALFCVLMLSFMFIKTGFIFWGTLLATISAIIVNFIILELFYNFIVSKKSKKIRMAISFVIALILAGLSIGMILIGITNFDYITDTKAKNVIEDVYEYKMTENLSINYMVYDVKYIENNSDKVKIVVKHSKYVDADIQEYGETLEVYCRPSNNSIMELVRDKIKEINNREIIEEPYPEIYIYSKKENIEKMKQNEKTKYETSIERELARFNQENQDLQNEIIELEDEIAELEDEIADKENTIEVLKSEIKDLNLELNDGVYSEELN